MKYDVFISYSSKNQKTVEAICAYLEQHKIRCFVAYRDIPKGVVWARAIVDALDESRMMVVVFSEEFNISEQVDREIELASEDHKPILTFRISDADFKGAKKYYLKNLNWIDAYPNPEVNFGSMLKSVAKLLDIKIEDSENTQTAKVEETPENETFIEKEEQINIQEPEVEDKPMVEKILGKEDSENTQTVKVEETPKVETPIEKEEQIDIQMPEVEEKPVVEKILGKEDSENTQTAKVEETPEKETFIEKEEQIDMQMPEVEKNPETEVVLPQTDKYTDHEWVDLGLPSGLKWATCNVGAKTPEGYGDYYAWGEVSTKKEYTKENCTTYGKTLGDISGDARYDAARANWGGSWRLPTAADCQELVDNCKWKWTRQNGVKGCKVTSKKNGNSIFLPAASYCEGVKIILRGEYGYYLSSILSKGNIENVRILSFFTFLGATRYVTERCCYFGYTVRPVCE